MEAPRFGTGSRRIKLLVIDDDEHVLSTISRMLRRDVEVALVRSGEEALVQIETGEFDVVLCDMSLPGIKGRDVWEAIRTQAPDLAERVVFMSGGAITGDDHAFFETIAERLVAKPFRRHELLVVLARFARR